MVSLHKQETQQLTWLLPIMWQKCDQRLSVMIFCVRIYLWGYWHWVYHPDFRRSEGVNLDRLSCVCCNLFSELLGYSWRNSSQLLLCNSMPNVIVFFNFSACLIPLLSPFPGVSMRDGAITQLRLHWSVFKFLWKWAFIVLAVILFKVMYFSYVMTLNAN